MGVRNSLNCIDRRGAGLARASTADVDRRAREMQRCEVHMTISLAYLASELARHRRVPVARERGCSSLPCPGRVAAGATRRGRVPRSSRSRRQQAPPVS
jgi:hypothetical protein